MTLRLPEKMRKKLKKPIGIICKKIEKNGKIITVGDKTSIIAIKSGIIPDLIIYDKHVKRKKYPESEEIEKLNIKKIEIINPAGTITDEAWIAIKEGLREKSKILVDGEEDLLVIPCVQEANEGSVIYYGQPDEGIVKVKITKDIKKQTRKFIDEMEVIK